MLTLDNFVDSTTQRVGESFVEFKYLREFEAKIGTAKKVMYGTYAEPIYAKTSEKTGSLPCPFN
jgi:hypothetical protein